MEYTIHRISLDIHTAKSQATLRVKQYDTSRKLHITLCEGGLPYHIATDCTATFSAIKADDKYIHNTCQIDGNTIEYTFTEQTAAAVGNTECEIALYNNKGQRITSPHFTIIVEERVYNGEEIVSSSEANVLNDLIDRAEVAVDNAEKVVDSIHHYVESNFANAFKGSMSGAIVQAEDVSPVEHIVGCKVRSKNLWNMAAFDNTNLLTFNDDGTVTVKESNYACTSNNTLKEACPSLMVGDVVTLSISTTGRPLVYLVGANVRVDNGVTLTITEDMLKSKVAFYGAYNQDADFAEAHTVNHIQLEMGTAITGYVPYADPATAKVTRCGKNLASPNLYSGKVGGFTYTPNEDGTLTISGAATTTSEHIIALALKDAKGQNISVPLKANKTYSLTVRKNGEKTTGIGTKVINANGTTKWGFDKTATQDRELALVYLQFTPQLGDTEYCGTYSVQLEVGNTATDYEPYAGETYSVNTDGTINGMTSLFPAMTIYADTADTVIECEYNRDSNKVVKGLYDLIMQETVVNTKVSSVKLLADAWEGDASPYSQAVSIPGVTENSMVDLTPSVEQLAVFHNKDLAFVTENVGGVVTVYAIGQKPTNDYTIPVAITEVKA